MESKRVRYSSEAQSILRVTNGLPSLGPCRPSKNWLCATILLALALGSCSTDPQAKLRQYLSSGAEYFNSGKYAEASIQFRNAVQTDPKSAPAHYQLAKTYLRMLNPDGAYREFSEALALDPSNADAQLELGALALGRREYDRAQSYAEKVLERDPKNARAHIVLAEKYLATSDTPRAIAEFEKAIELDPGKVEYYAALGAVCLSASKPLEAEAAYRKATEMNPKSLAARMSLAQFYFSQGKLVQAETEMLTAIALEPRSVTAQLLLARIYAIEGKLPEAEAVARRLKNVAPEDPGAYSALGQFYRSTGQKEKAAAEFQAVLASKPADAMVRQQLIETLIELKKTKEAAALNQEVLNANAEDIQGLLSQGRIYLAEGRPQEAITVLEKHVKVQPNSATGYYLLGNAQKAVGLSLQARDSYSRALNLNPRLSEAKVALARLATEQGDPDTGLRLATEAQSLGSAPLEASVTGAQALLAKGDLKRSEAVIEEVLKRDPVSLPALAVLMNVSLRQGNPQEMVKRLTKLSQENPQNAGLHLLLGVAYFETKDLNKSEANVKQALSIDPKTPEAHPMLANVYFARGANEQAKAELKAAIDANPRNLTNYLVLARQYEKEGNLQEARKLCERARALDPSSPLVANQLAYLILEQGGDINIALALAQQAKQKLPDSPNVADTLGWAYYKHGQSDAAISQITRCVQAQPANSTCHYHLGMAYLAAKNLEAAQRSLKLALRDPSSPDAERAKLALSKLPKVTP
jgi:cellulose synthase operon protein C